MKRFPPLSAEEIGARLRVDCETGQCFWIDATKHHRNLNGCEAGMPRPNRHGKSYWVIKINGVPYKRAQIVLTIASGRWPEELVDHIDGDSLNDQATNLRHATFTQNAWNHKTRRKSSPLPMGVRAVPSGRYQSRIACHKRTIHLGCFDTVEAASLAYQTARKEYFGDFS